MFSDVSGVFLQSIFKLLYWKTSGKYYNKRRITCDNGNVQSQGQEERKSNSIIIANSDAHPLVDDKIFKTLFNEANLPTIKNK